MISVKKGSEPHAAMLLGQLLDQSRGELLRHDWLTLRVSHLRVLSMVPDEGINVTELAARVGMTKQGCSQFVAQLIHSGHLQPEPNPDDKRVRRIVRTPLADAALAESERIVAGLEHRWAQAVGPDRYRSFREVLEEIARFAAAESDSMGLAPGSQPGTDQPTDDR